jgi:hypothetical protein
LLIRSRNANLLDGEARYKGKKISRAALAKDRGDQENVDAKEHSVAELGHMFDFGGDNDGEGDEDDSDEADKESDEYVEEEEVENDDDDDDARDEDGDETVAYEDVTDGSKSTYSFDYTTDFSNYADMDEEEENSGEEDEGEGEEESDQEEGSNGGEKSGGGKESEAEGEGVQGKQIRQESLVQEVAKGRAVQKQLDIWDKERSEI